MHIQIALLGIQEKICGNKMEKQKISKVVGLSNKEVLIQIGKHFFKLKFAFGIKDASELGPILDQYDVKILREYCGKTKTDKI